MAPATPPRLRHSRLPAPGFRPRLERLEERWVPSAVRQVPGFDASALPRGDDNSSFAVPLGFAINFHGRNLDHVFVNNNGNVTFPVQSGSGQAGSHNPFPLNYLGRPIIAPFFSDVDTRPADGGQVRYGRDVVDGRSAFGVTWDNVGYYNQQTDKTNRFQLVLTDRSDLAPGAFGIEFNYDRLEWDKSQTGFASARVGYSTGTNVPGETVELPGSGVVGAFLDGTPGSLASVGRVSFTVREPLAPVFEPISARLIHEGETLSVRTFASDLDHDQTLTYSLLSGPAGAAVDAATGLVTWTPNPSQPMGSYTFRVGVADSGNPSLTDEEAFTVFLENVVPVVTLTQPAAPYNAMGTEFTLAGRFSDPGYGGWEAVVDYGDGTAPEPLALNPDGSYVLRHTFDLQGNHTIVVSVADAQGGVGQVKLDVIVLPGGGVEVFQMVTANPGGEVTTHLVSPGQGAEVNVEFARDDKATGPATVFVAIYTDAPLATKRVGVFFDINVNNAAVGDEVTLKFQSDLVKGGFEFGFFDLATNQWVDLLHSPNLAEVTTDPATGTLTVRFKVTHIFGGTVFTVSLPSTSTTTTGTIQPPTAQAGTTPVSSDAGGGLSRAVSFSNNAQLSLALNTSHETRLAVSATSQGSQAANAAANGLNASVAAKSISLTAGSSGGDEEASKPESLGAARRGDEGSPWHWLQSEQGVLELLLNGVDPAMLVPMKLEEAALFFAAPEGLIPPAVPGDAAALEAVAVTPTPAEEGERGEFTAALLALVPGLLGIDRRRKPRRGELA